MTDLTSIKAVAFDAFETLVRIERPTRPLAPLMQWLRANSHPSEPDPFAPFMRDKFNLAALAPGLPQHIAAEIHARMSQEIGSITAFDDALPCLAALETAGIPTALCSNSIEPYAAAVLNALPHSWRATIWSYETGALKPDPLIFTTLCGSLDLEPDQILFVGDSLEHDYIGATTNGLKAIWLRRGHTCDAPDREIASLADLLQHLPTP